MPTAYDSIIELTAGTLASTERLRQLNDFAAELGWRPSDHADIPSAGDISVTHLLVEHGLQHTAVLSFLKWPRTYADLNAEEQLRLLAISYNNLVDWHIPIEKDHVSFVYVRTQLPTVVARQSLSRTNYESLRSAMFEQITQKAPNPNVPALDNALIRTISLWRRELKAILKGSVSLPNLSALFNGIIFVRALEDHRARLTGRPIDRLIDKLTSAESIGIGPALIEQVRTFTGHNIPGYLLNEDLLEPFDSLGSSITRELVLDFYRNRFAPFPYDFSIISKHALSRIYERYVSLLREPDTPQLSLLPQLPEELTDKSQGSYYTPEFIAKFFARYLREQIPPYSFKRLRYVDPACGSGIFLRTLLELQCDPAQSGTSKELTSATFAGILGIERDENAAQATRLSLALLYLVLTDLLPQTLPVVNDDALTFVRNDHQLRDKFGAVIANPPFVSHATMSDEDRARVASFMEGAARGRIDLNLAFVKLGLELLEPGGYGLYVLPHSFLIGDSAEAMRMAIASTCNVLCLVDLSNIRVFGEVSSYVILLIFRKRAPSGASDAPTATVVRSSESVGEALQDVIEGRRTISTKYSVYDIPQEEFAQKRWIILPPTETAIRSKLSRLPLLRDFLVIREGVVTGRDDVFILDAATVPDGEEEIFIPLLRDREMMAYTIQRRVKKRLFFPFVNGERLEEENIKKEFPGTWKHLLRNRKALEARGSLEKYGRAWWEPLWPRADNVVRPKVVAPHLTLVPKFSLDSRGRYAVSRSPMLLAKSQNDELELLKFFVAVLNSTPCYWHISTHSHKYRHGYVMLEPKTLSGTPVPDPVLVGASALRELIDTVERRLRADATASISLEKEIDRRVADLYGLSRSERSAIGLGD